MPLMPTMQTQPPPILEITEFLGDPVAPADFPKTILRHRNQRAAESVGLAALDDEAWLRHFARFDPLPDNLPEPLALRYHGHQFGTYNPELGDGRGFLFAQLRARGDDGGKVGGGGENRGSRWLDLGTKGSGQTPWSRQGDGRLTLKGGVREVLAATYLEALGVNTSKAFSLVETGEQLHRGDEPSPTRSAVLVRLSHSHIRFGSFQRLAYLGDTESLARLVNHCVQHYYPEADDPAMDRMAPALLERIGARVAAMVGEWMAAGFVHGVMNTDNFNITGETFDFGPYRFLPQSDPNLTAAYFDQTGLYRFGRQPTQALWALSKLASALLPLAEQDDLAAALRPFEAAYQTRFARHTLALLGLEDGPDLDADLAFMSNFYAWMTETGVPWPQVFFDWFGGSASETRAAASPIANQYGDPLFAPVRDGLLGRTPDRASRLSHAYFQGETPASLLYDEIEALWAPIADADDWSAYHAHLDRLEQLRLAMAGPGSSTPAS
ncbi:MAG: YdiU family protein [Pseudomonadota bacterium]